ncbi:DnaJ family domain-containing protein [Sporosarcina sp. BP05]|uniref:DnaJ family domain-containing protein n=1 Tax=Sporosarcina sp. BP05 TaxID=2758726 RepID=UPI002106D2DB|nr:DnaJ family domain-containing protein [Sporosarcina sp. BP05]
MDNLAGQGKPLPQEYFSGDTFQHFQRIAKDAGYKPHWLKLQHEIRDEVIAIAAIHATDTATVLESRIEKLNEKVFEYNKSCPAPMQKESVSVSNIEAAIDWWK